jgi:hypothetical protein
VKKNNIQGHTQMNQDIKTYIQAIETQNNNALHFDIESYLSYKNSILNAVLVLFENKSADEILQALKDEVKR